MCIIVYLLSQIIRYEMARDTHWYLLSSLYQYLLSIVYLLSIEIYEIARFRGRLVFFAMLVVAYNG